MVIIMERISTKKLCDYDCGKVANFILENGKSCCSSHYNSCPESKRKNSESQKGKFIGEKHWLFGKSRKTETKEKIGLKQIGCNNHYFLTIKKINKKYPFFSKIEELRYNSNKPGEKEIQVHCKNHLCENSKEKDGWFTPKRSQISERIRALEQPYGMIENNFYCSEKCKSACVLYRSHGGSSKNKEFYYTQSEYQTFRQHVLERDEYKCQICGELASDIHHERPQKLEPFFALDPDFGWSCCEKCHYEKGHKDECSTGKLANKVCI